MRKFLLLVLLCISITHNTEAQSCVPTNINGSVLNISCGQPCTSFAYQVPHLRSTTDYVLNTIPYSPLPYLVATGSEDINLYNDDQYSTLINLPFSFCFYGANYNSCVVGSNGLLTFDATNQGCANAYTISPTIPSSGGGAQCNQFSTYYPKAAIMGAYWDLDPRSAANGTTASPPERKIQWRVEGNAPCRKFVLSYYHIGVFGNTGTLSCGYTTPTTFQIIISESTGLIEVHFLNKSCNSSTNANKGILGIQDFTQMLARAAPGKNATSWSASNEAYRFTPNGGGSNFVSAQLFTLGGTFLATGDTATTTAGLLDINFPTICPPNNPSTQFVIQTTFNSCTGAATLTSFDTITVNRVNSLPATISMTATTCGANVGSVTVTPTAGTSPYTYVLNGGAPVTAPGPYTFTNLAAGPYTVVVTDFNGCTTTLNITVTSNTTIPGSATFTATSCPLSLDGTITITPGGGSAPYQFSLDAGAPQSSNIFTGVAAGSHTVTFIDAIGCSGTVNVTVGAGNTPLTANINTTATGCPGVNSGTITVTPTSGTAAYQYSLDGGLFQGSNVFTNVSAGAHTVTVRDAFGCTGSFTVNVAAGPALAANLNSTATSCPSAANGTITVTPTNGTSPYQYSLDGGAFQLGNTFTNVAAGPHSVTVKDVNGCTSSFPINVAAGPTLTATVNSTATSCAAVANGTITANPTNGTSPYQYSLDGGASQLGNTFTNVATGPHSVTITDANGCSNIFPVNVAAGPALTANMSSTATSCPAVSNGTVTATPTNGTAPYQYALDGGAFQPGNTFTNVAAGAHSVTVKDANGCTNIFPVNVAAGPTLTATISSTPASCAVAGNGTVTATATNGTAPYQYSLDGGASQPGNTFTNVSSGPHNVTITDANGCSNTFPVNVGVGPPLTATMNSTATSCSAVANGTVTATPTSGAPPYQYSLDGGTNQPSNVFTNVAAGSHNVTITDANGCSNTFPVNVAAGPSLTANMSSTATTCSVLNDGTITATATNGTAPYQYSLDGGAFQPGNVFTNVAAGSHNVTIRDANGCTNTFPVNVAIGSALTSTINGANPPCSNLNNGTITLTPTSGTAPYQYRLNAGPPQSGNVFSGLAPGFYTVDFIDVNGCTGSNTVTLTTNAAITATSTLVSPLCNGNANGSITINASGGVPAYQYSKNGGATYQASPVFSGLTAGNYIFRVKDAAGCIYDFPFSLTEPTVLTVSSFSLPASCPNNDGSITISAGGGTPAYAYSIDGGANYSPSITYLNLPIGQYNVRVKDANGCTASRIETVALLDTMRLDAGPDSTICFGSSVTLMPLTNAQTDTFRWRPRAGLNYDTAKNPIATPNDTTKYILLAKWGVCRRQDSLTIFVLHKPVALAGNDTTICNKTFAILNGSVANISGPVSYAWTPSTTVVPPNLPIAVATPDSTQQYVLTVSDNYGCNFVVADSMWVFMEAPVPAFAGNDTNALLAKPHHMKATGGVSYEWTPAGPLNNSHIANPIAILHNDTYFRVWVTDAIGCKAFDDVFIKVYEGPTYYLPNAFTPNGDGLNDIFLPVPVGMKSTDYFMIYNRLGELVFQTRLWMQGWDGTYKGKKADQGSYAWFIRGRDENGNLVEYKGMVTLIR